MNTDGTNCVPQGFCGAHAEWSHANNKIAYTNWGCGTYNSDIFIYDPAPCTSTQRTFHGPGEAFNQATWSPDGTQLALSKRGSNGHYDVCRINADGTNLVNLTSDWPDTDEEWPVWSPDGQYILFLRTVSGVTDIWSMRTSDGSRRSRTYINHDPPVPIEFFAVGARPYKLTVTVESHPDWGTIKVEPNLPNYDPNTIVTLRATPIDGKYWGRWSGNVPPGTSSPTL